MIDWKKYPRLVKFLSDTGMTVDEAYIFLEKKEQEERAKNPPDKYDLMKTEELIAECKRRGLL